MPFRMGAREPGQQVRPAGAGVADHHAGAVGDAAVRLGDVHRRLFVVRVEVADPVVGGVHHERDVRPVDDAAHEVDPFQLQAADEEFPDGDGGGGGRWRHGGILLPPSPPYQ
jgi:hypothetical protein